MIKAHQYSCRLDSYAEVLFICYEVSQVEDGLHEECQADYKGSLLVGTLDWKQRQASTNQA